MALKDKATKLNNDQLACMKGRDKGETFPTGSPVTIVDYGFLPGDDGDYVVLVFAEFVDKFFFGGSVVTDKIKELDKDLTDDERKELEKDGLPVLFTEKQSKNKRKYVTVEFFPDEPFYPIYDDNPF